MHRSRSALRAAWCLSISAFLASFVAAQSVPSQPPDTVEKSTTVLKKDTALVSVDLVVTDKSGTPIRDLKRDDIKVFENGKEQRVLHFEHVSTVQPKIPRLHREGWIDNYAQEHPQQSNATIILLDGLNLSPQDQSRARGYVVKTLEKLPAGQPVAVFVLGRSLVQIVGFTQDAATLRKVVDKVNLQHSAGLDSPSLVNELGNGTGIVSTDAAAAAVSPTNNLANLSQLMKETQELAEQMGRAADAKLRADSTLDALDALARYASGFPGRKNLVWLSDAFPFDVLLQDIHLASGNYAEKTKRVTSRLAAARVAVYPVMIEGLTSYSSAEQQTAAFDARTASPTGAAALDHNVFAGGVSQHQGSINTIKMIAEQTGGTPYFNGNDFPGEIQKASADASDYYALDYAPPPARDNDILRNISVSTTRPNAVLRYRHSYYPKIAGEATSSELEQALNPTLPLRDGLELATSAARCGAHTLPLVVALGDLQLGSMKDGRKSAGLSVGYVAVPLARSKDLKTLRAMHDIDLPIDLAEWESVQKNGLPLTMQIQLPPGEYRLRAGVYDRNSRRTGTIDVDYSSLPCPANEAASTLAALPPDLLPEAAILKEDSYDNRYYGFHLDLPVAQGIRRQPLRIMPKGIHGLLALQVEEHLHSGFLVSYATDVDSGKTVDAKLAAEEEAKRAVKEGMTVLEGPMERTRQDVRLWALVEQGPDPKRRTIVLFAPRRESLLKFAATSDDEVMFKNLAIALNRLRFTRDLADGASTPENAYLGPALPARKVEDALATQPGRNLAGDGAFSDSSYRNQSLALGYQFPDGWKPEPLDAGVADFERTHSPKADDESGPREHALFRACSKPLFFIVKGQEPASGEKVSLFVTDPACLGVPLAEGGDPAALSEVASRLSLFQDFGDVHSAGTSKLGTHSVIVLHGEISYPAADPKMFERRWQDAFVIPYRNTYLLLLWTHARSGEKSDALLEAVKID